MYIEIDFPGSGSVSGGTSLSSGPPPSLPGSPSSTKGESDVLESASSDPPAGTTSSGVTLQTPAPLSIVDFSMTMNAATDKNQETLYSTQAFDDTKLVQFYNGNVLSALALMKIQAQLTTLAPSVTQVFSNETSNESTLNGQISSINSGLIASDNSQINTMNQAIITFANSSMTQQDLNTYFAAVATYNAYVAGRGSQVTSATTDIQTYNDNVTNENKQILQINTNINDLGLNLQNLSNQNSYTQTVGTPPTLSTTVVETNLIANENPLTKAKLSITPDLSNLNTTQIVSFYFTPLFNLQNENLRELTQQLNKMSNYQGFLQFFRQAPHFSLPTSYATPKPNVQSATSPQGTGGGSGVSLTSMVTSLNSPVMARVIESQSYNSNLALLQDPQNQQHLVNQVQFLNLSSLAQLGLSAGSPTPRLLTGRLATYDTEQSPVALTVALAFSSQLLKTADTPAFKEGVNALLKDQGIENADNLSSSLTAAAHLLGLHTAITLLGSALNNPHLGSQLLSTLDSTREIAANQANNELNVTDIMHNSVSTDFLKATLTNQAVQDGALESDRAGAAVNSAVNEAALISANHSQEDVINEIGSQLAKQGLQQNEANKLSALAHSFVQAEIAGKFQLDSNVSANQLDARHLSDQLQSQKIEGGVAQNAANFALNSGNVQTTRQLRDQLSAGLVAQGVSQGTALLAATHAVVPAVATPGITSNPAISTLPTGLSASAADHVASTIQGLQNSLDRTVQTLRSQNNNQVNEALDNNLRTFLKPTLSVYNFSQNVIDPGKTLVNMWSNLRLPLPSNFHKSEEMRA